MKIRRFMTSLLLAFAIILAPSIVVQAQEPPPDGGYPGQGQGYPGQGYPGQGYPGSEDQGQPPQGVARVSVVEGNLSTQRGDSGSWVADTINTPVAVGDALSTDQNSRAEVQLDYANVLRLGPATQARLADLVQGHLQVQVAQGIVDYAVLRGNQAQSEIDTQNVGIQPGAEGVYRVEAISPSETRVTVWRGQAQIVVEQGSTAVQQGQTITIQGTDDPQYQVTQAQGPDAWDRWNEDRDQAILQAKSWQYTDPYYTGTQDLDNYGQWQNAPDYGQVWVPNQGSDWAPYSDGDWDWEPGWGWTWVSAEPWGWAPYHYGRWFFWNNSWAWWPGPVGRGLGWYRPIWAPAYVSFFGFGGFGLGFGWGGGWGWGRVGWLPVGPSDRFFPWWGRGGVDTMAMRGFAGVNALHGGIAPLAPGNRPFGSNLSAAMNNARVLRGVSTMAGNRFGQGGVRPQAGGVTSQMLRSGSLVTGRLGAVPSRASLSATNRAPASGTVRGNMGSSHFAGTPAPSFSHASFTQAQANARQAARANVDAVNRGGSFGESRAPSAEFNRSGAPSSSAAARPSSSPAGWQRFASPNGSRASTTEPGRSSSPSAGSPRTGWSRFGSQPAPRTASGYYGGSAGRPPLQMNRPMFSPRSAPAAGAYSRGGYGGYSGYRTPSSRSYGTYSQPSARTAGGSGGRPGSYGGSHSSGGGSHASGGGHFGGGGGSHGGGGGHHR
jgi:FecR protein